MSEEGSASRAAAYAIAGLFALRTLCIWALPIEALSRLLPDDAWMYITLAEAIGSGLGPVAGGAPTNGFQPAYALLLGAMNGVFGIEGIHLMRVGMEFGAIAEAAILVALTRVMSRAGVRPVAQLLVVGIWVLNPNTTLIGMNGMESLPAAAMLLFAAITIARASVAPTVGRAASAGAVLGLAALFRLDALILAPVAVALLMRGDTALADKLKQGGAAAIACAATLAPWFGWSVFTVDRLMPVSGAAVRFQSFCGNGGDLAGPPTGADHLHAMPFDRALSMAFVAFGNIALLSIAAGALSYLLWRLADRPRFADLVPDEQAPMLRALMVALVSWSAIAFLAYSFYVFGAWYYSRYLFSTMFAPLLLFGLLASALRPTRAQLVGCIALASVTITTTWLVERARLHFIDNFAATRALVAALPADAIVGSSQSGTLEFLRPRGNTINLDGKLNIAGFNATLDDDVLGWARREGVEYVVNWPVHMHKLCSHSKPADCEALRLVPFESPDAPVWQIYRFED